MSTEPGTRIGPYTISDKLGESDERFLVLIDPEAQYQTLSVLVSWPARL